MHYEFESLKTMSMKGTRPHAVAVSVSSLAAASTEPLVLAEADGPQSRRRGMRPALPVSAGNGKRTGPVEPGLRAILYPSVPRRRSDCYQPLSSCALIQNPIDQLHEPLVLYNYRHVACVPTTLLSHLKLRCSSPVQAHQQKTRSIISTLQDDPAQGSCCSLDSFA